MLLLILQIALLVVSTFSKDTVDQAAFTRKIFNEVAKGNANKNLIISPTSIQTDLAMVYMGAVGDTAEELRKGLHLGGEVVKKIVVAKEFQKLLNKLKSIRKATVRMANRIYVGNKFKLMSNYNALTRQYFDSIAEIVDFSKPLETANKINQWVAVQTANKIQNIVTPDDFNEGSAAVAVNAIYFKAMWEKKFRNFETKKKDFHLSTTLTKTVEMMYQEDAFLYAALPELDAKAVSLAYDGTDIRMLVVLPNKLEGLGQLEEKLKNTQFDSLLKNLVLKPVHLSLPKFKIEFQLDLGIALNNLGISKVFVSGAANLSAMMKAKDNLFLTKVVHKAFIEVNEDGTEAAAVTASMIQQDSGSALIYEEFKADHPFYFALYDKETIYFAGHMANIPK